MASSISCGTRFFSTGFLRLISCKRQLAAFVVELLEAVEAVAAVAHHLAGLADVAELLGQLQQSNFGADDLLFGGHVRLGRFRQLLLGFCEVRRSRSNAWSNISLELRRSKRAARASRKAVRTSSGTGAREGSDLARSRRRGVHGSPLLLPGSRSSGGLPVP